MLKWAKNILGFKSTAAFIAPVEYAQSAAPEAANTSVQMNVQEPTFDDYQRAQPGVTPDWCRAAFRFERQRRKSETTDWGFVTPVWILMGLVCVIAQVALAQWAFGAFV
ncbi:MAG: hypothetical protein AAFR51_10075 [Pseudomonadota bacterium]